MLQTHIYITCDECRNPFPSCGICPSPMDGAIYTPAMVRSEAREKGWRQMRQPLANPRDICPRCLKKLAKKGGR